MSTLYLFKRVEQTKNLPHGHIETKKAQEALDKEYALCKEVEIKWQKRMKKSLNFNQEKEATDFCNSICDALGERHIKGVTFNSVTTVGAGAEYSKGEIRCAWNCVGVPVLIHELTHHCGRHHHDKSFCEVEELLFSVTYQKVTGKPLHTDW